MPNYETKSQFGLEVSDPSLRRRKPHPPIDPLLSDSALLETRPPSCYRTRMKKIALFCFALIFTGCAETSHEPQSSSAQQSVADAKSSAPAPSACGATTGPTIE